MTTDNPVVKLRQAIDHTLAAIADGKAQVQEIAESTLTEVQRMEAELEQVQGACNEAIDEVERLEVASRVARHHLMEVNRDVGHRGERDMQMAYQKAQRLQLDLGQWRERETQLRFRRDDLTRRLRAMRATAQHAEVLMVRFGQASNLLDAEFGDVDAVLQNAQMQILMGLRMLQMEEDERRRLANRLHDGPLQNLAGLSMRLQSGVGQLAEQGVAVGGSWVEDIQQRFQGVLHQLRETVFELRPPLLDDLGLVLTLRRYVEQWSENGRLQVDIQLRGLETRLSPTEKLTVFRAIQETFHNIAEHTQADRVVVILVYGPEVLRVEVQDNGQGIAFSSWMEWVEAGKMGLTLCRQRLSVLGGDLWFEPVPQGGSRVVMTLPLARSE